MVLSEFEVWTPENEPKFGNISLDNFEYVDNLNDNLYSHSDNLKNVSLNYCY
jgi:hypothetical protein